MTDSSLSTQWAVCGIAAAAARFVPVPLLDDVIRRRAAQVAVLRTLRAHGRTQPADRYAALWDDPEGASRGLRGRLGSVPRRLLLFPVRKYTAVFGAVRGVPNDVARVVLLARSVERQVERGELASPDRVEDEARALRRAVDAALSGMDLRLLTAGLADALSQGRGLTTAAVAFVRRRLGDDDLEASVPADGVLADGAAQVTEVLRRPEVEALLERFDAQVDDRLARR
jgi:hypothetical protein